jgi:hypothetical protein
LAGSILVCTDRNRDGERADRLRLGPVEAALLETT